MDINKIITDNPIVDNLIYYVKILGFESITKDQNLALKYETVDSLRRSDLYLSTVEGSITFDMYTYNKEILTRSGVPEYLIMDCIRDPHKIPFNLRDMAFKNMKEYTLNNYIELNNYYRMLNGKSDLNSEKLYIDPEDYNISMEDIDFNKPVDEFSEYEIKILESMGIINILKEDYPELKYLNFLGGNSIPYHISRRTERFGLLRVPYINIPEITSKWKSMYETNRVYTLKTIYSDAFKYNNNYYDNFIQLFIKIQTIVSMVIDLPDYLIRKEFFDIKSIKYMFESNGIEFFEEIPLKYQISMMKNLNTLIKFKSTTKNMIDICSLFGFDNIEIFKYYLLKDRNVDINGDYTFIYKQVEDPSNPELMIDVLDDEENYTLRFIKVPIEEMLDDYVRDPGSIIGYDELTTDDQYWNGDKDPSLVKAEILKKEFNIERSKYISIDSIYEMSNLSFELSYFFNILFESNMKVQLQIQVPFIDANASFKLLDIIFYLYLLMYEQNGIVDDIMDTTSKVLHIKGFNFKANLGEIATWLAKQGKTLADIGIEGFNNQSNIVSYSQLLEIYTTNRDIHNHLIEQMHSADNIEIYNIYKTIYDALMVTTMNNSIFELDNGIIAPTYTDYFAEKNIILYNHIKYIRSLANNEKENYISETISAIIEALEENMDTSTQFSFIFSNIPQLSSELIKGYIYKVINFFKSYKVDFTSINIIYKFDDKIDNKIQIIDNAYIGIVNFLKSNIYTNNDLLKTLRIKYDIKSIYELDERIIKTLVTYSSKELVEIKDYVIFLINILQKDLEQSYQYNDDNDIKSKLILNDNGLDIFDHVYIYQTSN